MESDFHSIVFLNSCRPCTQDKQEDWSLTIDEKKKKTFLSESCIVCCNRKTITSIATTNRNICTMVLLLDAAFMVFFCLQLIIFYLFGGHSAAFLNFHRSIYLQNRRLNRRCYSKRDSNQKSYVCIQQFKVF